MHFINLSGYLAASVQIKPVVRIMSGQNSSTRGAALRHDLVGQPAWTRGLKHVCCCVD